MPRSTITSKRQTTVPDDAVKAVHEARKTRGRI